tara:strand:- start:1479 stop:3056 length:1578 start_codon:yes stop_codon:yes gene_type:complete
MNTNKDPKNMNIDEQEIDFSEILNSIIRQRIYLVSISSISVFLGIIYSFILKPSWEGHFQIVIKTQSSQLMNNSQFEQLNSVLNQSEVSELKTELKILESPSILKPIFDFVKESRSKAKGKKSSLDFYTWKSKNLDISLEKGTSVLNLTYKDKDKSIIIPVLNKISKAYQIYSGSERKKNLTQGISFLETQIRKTNIKSKESLLKLQKFSLKNGLGNRDGLPMAGKSAEINLSASSIQNENFKKDFANFLTQNLNTPVSTNESQLRFDIQYTKLGRLESMLLEKSLILKPNSKYIINLKNEIKSLKESLTRSPEILVKYRKLKYEAVRDEQLLENLEVNLSNLQLENAKQSNPWDLISKPTLIDDPVSPSRINIIGIFLLAGIFTGSIISILVDKSSGKIYKLEDLKNKINYPLLKTLSISSSNYKNTMNLLANRIKQKNSSMITLIPVGNSFRKDHIEIISKSLKNEIGDSQVTISNKINTSLNTTNQILMLSAGSSSYDELNEILEDLKIQNGIVEGWMIIDN